MPAVAMAIVASAKHLAERALPLLAALAVGAAFWVPASDVARGFFPAPLDDVYIHFDFARSLGSGHPFEWIPGQGYSSGETSPLYAIVLAIGWLVGFRGRLLGIWAAIVAILSIASLVRSTRKLVAPCPWWIAGGAALVPLAFGVVDWALVSGMEVALFVAALARTLLALDRTTSKATGGPTREALQWRLGLWGAVIVLLRPEAAILVALHATIAARASGTRSAFLALSRSAIPGAFATLLVLGVNELATGDPRSAGALLKLFSSQPFLSDVDRARAFVENLVTFWMKVIRGELAFTPRLLFILPFLALGALFTRRPVAVAAILGALAWTLLVSWNGNAPHHNFRYYAPALVLLAIGAAITIGAIARRKKLASLALLGAALGVALPTMPAQIRHFRSAAKNIRDQHVEVGARIARLPEGTRVLLGDAGAIPYVSERPAIDALGLGGYRRMPFVRAALHGEVATVELIERLPPEERPTHLALYPNWFRILTDRFGHEVDRVTITNNIICGGPTKAIYRADWSALEREHVVESGTVDEIDVADVVSEEEHGYVAPLPHGGWTTFEILEDRSGAKRFDGGRIVPHGATESFLVRATGPLRLRMRVDDSARKIVVRTDRGEQELLLDPVRPGTWREATATIDLGTASRITLEARDGAYKDYHVWIERAATDAATTSTRNTAASP